MAGLYARLSCDALTDAKLLAVGPDGFTLWAKGLLYAKQHLTDGEIDENALELCGIGVRNVRKVAAKLVQVGLWKRTENGYSVGAEKWAKHQTTKAEVESERAASRERQRRYREQKEAARNGVTNTVSNGVTDAELRQPETETETETIYREDKSSLSVDAREKRKRFVPPTQQECADYAKAKSYPLTEAKKFWMFYQSKGWMVGRNKMVDWHMAMGGWMSDKRGSSPAGVVRTEAVVG